MPNDQNNFGVALYYPFINVQNLDWLKCSLLYWDSIRCITPSSDYFEDDIKYLFDEGLIIPTSPKEYSTDASVYFVSKMQKYCHNQGELDIKARKYLDKNFPELKNLTLHDEKLNEKIFREMGHKVILGQFVDGDSRFYHAQPYISALYLMTLAREMSNKIRAPMLTDVVGLSGLGQHILWSDTIIPEETNQDNILMQLNIDFPSSEQLAKLSFDDILIFNRKRIDERRRFRNAVENIRSESQKIEDPNALADYLNDQKQDIQQAIHNHQKSLRDIGIKDFTSTIKAAWPSLLAIPIGAVAGASVGVLSALVLSGLSIAYSKTAISQEKRKAINDCPWHYSINLEQEII
jgi:hypothetical protein